MIKILKNILKKTSLIVPVLLALVSFLVMPAHPVEAAPVQIVLGESGSAPWAVGPIKPGDSGIKVITVQNSGSNSGDLTLWLSDIINTEGTSLKFENPQDSAGELGDYLTLKVSSPRITANITMPDLITDFPGSSNDSRSLKVLNLLPGETVTLNWEWNLPEATGNIVQGDGITFTINYLLEDFSTPTPSPTNRPGGGGGGNGSGKASPTITPSPSVTSTPSPTPEIFNTLELDLVNSTVTVPINAEGRIAENLNGSSQDGSFSLSIPEGTQLLVSDVNRLDAVAESTVNITIPQKITVDIQSAAPAPPEGWVQVSPAYDISGMADGQVHGIRMDKSALLLIQYDTGLLPESVDSLATFYYNPQSGWTQLQPPSGYVAEAGQSAAQTDHFSLFAVLAKSGKAIGPPPAYFTIQNLSLNPPHITVGESSDLKVMVNNSGGMPGEYRVIVRLNGVFQESQSIFLNPGQSQNLGMILTPEASGIYTVSVGFLSGDLIVDPLAPVIAKESTYGWLIYIALALSILASALFFLRKNKKNEAYAAASPQIRSPEKGLIPAAAIPQEENQGEITNSETPPEAQPEQIQDVETGPVVPVSGEATVKEGTKQAILREEFKQVESIKIIPGLSVNNNSLKKTEQSQVDDSRKTNGEEPHPGKRSSESTRSSHKEEK